MDSLEFPISQPDKFSAVRVILPPDFKQALDGQTTLPAEDFAFMTDLLRDYRLRGAETAEERPFRRDEFFEALGKVKDYSDSLRESLDTQFTNDLPVPSSNSTRQEVDNYAKREQDRPSAVRISDLCYLFLHYPPMKTIYDRIQTDKMAEALPDFIRQLSAVDGEAIADKDAYFSKVLSLMGDSMNTVAGNYNQTQVELLGWTIGYENEAYQIPQERRQKYFAVIGNETFTKYLNLVVTEVGGSGEGLRTRLREEFLPGDGLGHQLMRTQLSSFAREIKPAMEEEGLDGARRKLRENSFLDGMCPASLRGKGEGGKLTDRPVAFEYASVIARNMPRRFIRRG